MVAAFVVIILLIVLFPGLMDKLGMAGAWLLVLGAVATAAVILWRNPDVAEFVLAFMAFCLGLGLLIGVPLNKLTTGKWWSKR